MLLFFFSLFVVPRDLHSFPTRRSSDLILGLSDGLRPHEALTVRVRREDGDQISFTAVARETKSDRKSTRLNSSHTVISYAVFCLKKKNLLHMDRCRFAADDRWGFQYEQ